MLRALAPIDAASAARGPEAVALRAPSETTAQTYTVVAGDTVSSIAGSHGLRTTDVLALNGLSWSSIIQPGQVLVLTAMATAPASVPSGTVGTYVVAAGDTVSSISAAHALSIDAVLAANGLDLSSIIYPGQSLAIPGAATPMAAIATAETPAPPEPAAPVSPAATHAVAAGDTISSIAAAHGLSIDAVLAANGLDWSSIIYPGEVLAIPGSSGFELVASSAPAAAASTALDAEQTGNARIIIAVGREIGISDRGIAIALGTAMQESWLRNLDWGDRDSLGLFQQRPSMGWGSEAEVRDAWRSTRAFYGGPSDPNGYNTRGLLDISGWESMSFADAAQAVQISAYPDRYAQWEQPAYAWLAANG
jgi:N-acetylmuramoyl-L-alanine amidase